MQPDQGQRMAIIGERVCKRMLALYTVPDHLRAAGTSRQAVEEATAAQKGAINELANAVNRTLPSTATPEAMARICDKAMDRVVAGHRYRSWPSIGDICAEVEHLSKIAIEDAARQRAGTVPMLAAPAPRPQGRDAWTLDGAMAAVKRCDDEIAAITRQRHPDDMRLATVKSLRRMAESAVRRLSQDESAPLKRGRAA